MILDLFAGPGGWEEGLRLLGHHDPLDLGIEHDQWACETARAAGHNRLQADVETLTPVEFGPVTGLIASPPCQAWSSAGQGLGLLDQPAVHELVTRMADGDDSINWTTWHDPRSHLVAQPVRWARDLRPEWIAMEEVPQVLPLWEQIAGVLATWGYSVWTGVLCAADYGVPQTRRRAILMASRTMRVHPPIPTHSRIPSLITQPWVSMATALGWGFDEPSATISGGGTSTGGAEPFANAAYRQRLRIVTHQRTGDDRSAYYARDAERPAPTLTGDTRLWHFVNGNQPNSAVRALDEPAPTIHFGANCNEVTWQTRPATTVSSRDAIAKPGTRDWAGGERQWDGATRVTEQEAAILQSFPADYPWQGGKGKKFQQIGNAIPPLLAAHIIGALAWPTTYLAQLDNTPRKVA